MSTTTKERPILMSGEMVRAILSGNKTQTRRIVDRVAGFGKVREFSPSDTPGYDFNFRCRRGLWQDFRRTEIFDRCPYGMPGDRLWVRECFYIDHIDHVIGPLVKPDGEIPIYYRADGDCCLQIPECCCCEVGKPRWRPSIHMPRWASRITLEITGVRVERLQEISDQDAVSEGIEILDSFDPEFGARGTFRELWQSINGPDSWDLNPWVWVVCFERIGGNQ